MCFRFIFQLQRYLHVFCWRCFEAHSKQFRHSFAKWFFIQQWLHSLPIIRYLFLWVVFQFGHNCDTYCCLCPCWGCCLRDCSFFVHVDFFIIRSTKTTVFVILFLRSANCLLQYFVDLFDPSLLWLRFSELSRVPLFLEVARFVCQCQTYLLWRQNWLPHFNNEARSYWFWAIHFEL